MANHGLETRLVHGMSTFLQGNNWVCSVRGQANAALELRMWSLDKFSDV